MNEENETIVLEDTEIVSDDTEIVLEDTEIVENTELSDDDLSAKMDVILHLLNGEAGAGEELNPEEGSLLTLDGSDSSTASAIDYAESIDKVNESLTVILMILIFWFCVWMLDKWRVWTVKGGR